MDESVRRKNKWEEYAARVDTSTPSKIATFELTVENTLKLLKGQTKGKLLDIGCGFGEIDVLLARNTDFQITACDISERCIDRARKNVLEAGLSNRIIVEKGDVYQLPYRDNEFDVVTSFGYTSAATYRGVQGEVARVLKPAGLLICDFINPFSLYKLIKFVSAHNKIRNREYDALSLCSIRDYFEKHNLIFQKQRLFNVYPPLNFVPKKCIIAFETVFGKLFHGLLGRVRLACFKKG